MKPFMIALLLVGCGPVPPIETKVDCLTFHSWEQPNREALEYNVLLARRVLYPVVINGFCEAFKGLYIEIKESDGWECDLAPGGQCVTGNAYPDSVYLTRSTQALAHELLHVWEFRAGINDTANHTDWDKKGYYEFGWTAARLTNNPYWDP